jgi:hypothetical protein
MTISIESPRNTYVSLDVILFLSIFCLFIVAFYRRLLQEIYAILVCYINLSYVFPEKCSIIEHSENVQFFPIFEACPKKAPDFTLSHGAFSGKTLGS